MISKKTKKQKIFNLMINTKKNFLLGLAILVSGVFATSCKNPLAEMVKLAKDQELTVDPNPLELHGNSVGFNMSAKLPVKMMKKGTKYTLEVAYVAGPIQNFEDMKPLPTDALKVGAIPFDGDKYQGQTTDPKVTKDFSFAYQDKYEVGGLVIKGIATKGEGEKAKSKEFGPVKMVVQDGRFVKGIATTALLVKSPVDGATSGDSPFAYAAHNYTGQQPEYMEIPVYFEQGSSTVLPSTASNKETINMIAELFKDTKVPAFTASGSSSHSPEGREVTNRDLAENRAKALEQSFKGKLAALKVPKEAIEGYQFNLEKKVLGETLPDFNSLVDGSSLNEEQKSEAKGIMSRDGDFTEKEMALHDKSYYKTLMSEVYPKMRYAKTSVQKPVATLSDAEMSAVVKNIMVDKEKADKLTEQEYLKIAESTPALDERIAILKAGKEKANYDTWKVNNNIGAAYLDMALLKNDKSQVDNALTYFETAMQRKETGETAYNMAMAYSMKGDKAKMEEYLEKASNLGSTDAKVQALINGAKGYMSIKAASSRTDGKYKEAEDILAQATQSNPNIFNKGLAQLLQGTNYDAAIASFESAAQKNPNDAITQYGLAVANARKGNESGMASALKKACELNADLKAKAIKDVEFDKYVASTSFKDAIK
jgi:tetratricopeptide (TPR) repeat protein